MKYVFDMLFLRVDGGSNIYSSCRADVASPRILKRVRSFH